jgi:hypothetical protein
LVDDDRRATRPTTADAPHGPAGSIPADKRTSAGVSAETRPTCRDRLSSRRRIDRPGRGFSAKISQRLTDQSMYNPMGVFSRLSGRPG